MVKNYLITALRVLHRYRVYTLLNVAGLATGLAGGILIFMLLRYHGQFDRHHEHPERLYRVVTDLVYPASVWHSPGVPFPTGAALRREIAPAQLVATIRGVDALLATTDAPAGARQRFAEAGTVAYAEPEFFRLFRFYRRLGQQPERALSTPNVAVLTERYARKYFGDAPVLGRLLRVDNRLTVTVVGVINDPPETTDFRYDCYLSMATLRADQPSLNDDWASVNNRTQCFVRLPEGYDPAQADGLLAAQFVPKHHPRREAVRYQHRLQPLADLHFNATYNGIDSKPMLWALALVGVLLVLASGFNFVNLATSQATRRSREIGVRKVMGGQRGQLLTQFMTETALIVLTSVGLAVGLAYGLLPYFNDVFQARIPFTLFTDSTLLGFLFGLAGLVTVGAGLYPALILSGFEPVQALRGQGARAMTSRFSLRKTLVVGQLAVTQLLVFGAVVVSRQSQFLSQAALGFESTDVVQMPLPPAPKVVVEKLTDQLRHLPGVREVSCSLGPPAAATNNTASFRYGTQDLREGDQANVKFADPEYLTTYGLRLAAGRNVAAGDSVGEFLVNEAFVRRVHAPTAAAVLNQPLATSGRRGVVVGVLRDFHLQSLQAPIEPCVITSNPVAYQTVGVRIRPENRPATLAQLRERWEAAFPDEVFRHEFLSERLRQFYFVEELLARIIGFFTVLAVLVGGVGLYGLIAFVSEQRRKEICLRKVMGASPLSLYWLLAREFVQQAVVACVLVLPLAWWGLGTWLGFYAYRIRLDAGVVVLSLGLCLLVVLLTVSYRIYRSGQADPARVLKAD